MRVLISMRNGLRYRLAGAIASALNMHFAADASLQALTARRNRRDALCAASAIRPDIFGCYGGVSAKIPVLPHGFIGLQKIHGGVYFWSIRARWLVKTGCWLRLRHWPLRLRRFSRNPAGRGRRAVRRRCRDSGRGSGGWRRGSPGGFSGTGRGARRAGC